MAYVVSRVLLLVELDRRGISVWRNRSGWWFADQKALTLALVDDKPKEVFGPFESAVAAGAHALNREAEKAA